MQNRNNEEIHLASGWGFMMNILGDEIFGETDFGKDDYGHENGRIRLWNNIGTAEIMK